MQVRLDLRHRNGHRERLHDPPPMLRVVDARGPQDRELLVLAECALQQRQRPWRMVWVVDVAEEDRLLGDEALAEYPRQAALVYPRLARERLARGRSDRVRDEVGV